MGEEKQKRKKRSKEEVAAARKYYLEEKEKRRCEREEKKKAREEARAARLKAREDRAKLRELRSNRKRPKVETLEDVLSRIMHSIPKYKGEIKVGDRIVFVFAGGYHIGEVKEIYVDKVFEGGMYKDLKTYRTVEYGTKYPLSAERILAKIDKEKFK